MSGCLYYFVSDQSSLEDCPAKVVVTQIVTQPDVVLIVKYPVKWTAVYLELLQRILGSGRSLETPGSIFLVISRWCADDILRLDLLRVGHEDVSQPLDDERAHRVVCLGRYLRQRIQWLLRKHFPTV